MTLSKRSQDRDWQGKDAYVQPFLTPEGERLLSDYLNERKKAEMLESQKYVIQKQKTLKK